MVSPAKWLASTRTGPVSDQPTQEWLASTRTGPAEWLASSRTGTAEWAATTATGPAERSASRYYNWSSGVVGQHFDWSTGFPWSLNVLESLGTKCDAGKSWKSHEILPKKSSGPGIRTTSWKKSLKVLQFSVAWMLVVLSIPHQCAVSAPIALLWQPSSF